MRGVVFVFFFLVLPGFSSANEYVKCVQNQLAYLGYNPGPADGINGSRTKKALREFRENSPNDAEFEHLSDFGDTTAQAWCSAISEALPQVAQFVPRERLYPVETSGALGEFGQVFLEDLYLDVLAFYKDGWGIDISASHFVFGSEDPAFLASAVRASLRKSGLPDAGNINRRMREVCRAGRFVTGIAYYNSIAVCWKPLSANHQSNKHAWAADMRMEVGAMLTHEYFHFIQHVLANEVKRGGKTIDGQHLLGPAWLLEGAAAYFELRYWRSRKEGFSGPSIANLQEIYKEHAVPLQQLEGFGSVKTHEHYRVALLAAELLAARAGEKTLLEFWTLLGSGQTRNAAFLQAFEIDLGKFEVAFSELASSGSAAAIFTKSK